MSAPAESGGGAALDGAPFTGREIAFENVFNVRDLGGHRAADGRTVREGRWFRGAGLHRVAGADVELLRSLGVRTALDLRTSAELEQHGAFPAEATGIEALHLPLIPRTWPHVAEFDDEREAVAFLVERFAEMLDSGAPAFRGAVEALARPEGGPVIAFCMAGKDRTGVLTATILSLLGVPDEEVARDFHRSQFAMERMVAWMAANEPGRASAMVQQSAHVRAAPPSAILGYLAELRRRHGSVAGYLAETGLDAEALERLRAALLDDPGRGERGR